MRRQPWPSCHCETRTRCYLFTLVIQGTIWIYWTDNTIVMMYSAFRWDQGDWMVVKNWNYTYIFIQPFDSCSFWKFCGFGNTLMSRKSSRGIRVIKVYSFQLFIFLCIYTLYIQYIGLFFVPFHVGFSHLDVMLVECYDPKADQWNILQTPILEGRSGPGCAVLDDSIFLVGGYSWSMVQFSLLFEMKCNHS